MRIIRYYRSLVYSQFTFSISGSTETQSINSSTYVPGCRSDGATACVPAVSAVFIWKPHRENGLVQMHEAISTRPQVDQIASPCSRPAGQNAFNTTGSPVDREALLAVGA